MGQAARSTSQNPFGIALPPDVASLAVERINDIVMVTETEPFEEPGMHVLFVNPAFERITGYTANEALGRSPRFLQGPGTSAAEILRIEAALLARRPVRAELLNYKKDGTPFWVEIEASTLRSPTSETEYFVFIERDITERKGEEVALRERERSIQTLFSNLPGMAYRCLNDKFWTMEFVSDGYFRLVGHVQVDMVLYGSVAVCAAAAPAAATTRTAAGSRAVRICSSHACSLAAHCSACPRRSRRRRRRMIFSAASSGARTAPRSAA